MKEPRTLITVLIALAVGAVVTGIFGIAAGQLTVGIVLFGGAVFGVLCIVLSSRRPKAYDTPPSPDERQIWWP